MADDISVKIFNAIKEIQGLNDPEVFVKKLLKDTLNWPLKLTNSKNSNLMTLDMIGIQNLKLWDCVVMKVFKTSSKSQNFLDGRWACLL